MVGKILSFIGGMIVFWIVVFVIGLVLLGSQQGERAPVAAERTIQERQREAQQASAYEEEARQGEYARLGITSK
jgi:Sec-independent protein translocase protein TatA